MNHVLSTHILVSHRLNTVWLDKISHAGVPAVELFCARQHLDYRNKSQVAELGHWFREAELKVHAVHSPIHSDDVWGRSGPTSVLDITEPVKGKRISVTDEIKRALEIAEDIPFKYLIQHLGASGQEYDERRIDAGFNALEELLLFAHQRGVEILLENIPNELSKSDRLIQFVNQTHLRLGFCFDIGHANIEGNVERAFETMKERIRSTHLHDNDGKADLHLYPFLSEGGTIDWKAAMRLLRSRESQYPLVLELKEAVNLGNPLEAVKQIFDKLETLDVTNHD